jgi:hypothetical protein
VKDYLSLCPDLPCHVRVMRLRTCLGRVAFGTILNVLEVGVAKYEAGGWGTISYVQTWIM